MKTFKKFLSVFLVFVTIFTTFSVVMPVFAAEIEASTEAESSAEMVENKPEILYEITEDRTANTKSFMQSDGTRLIAQYSDSVHYENADGELAEYDNSLSEAEAEDGEKEYKTKDSDVDIRISKKTNGKKLVRVTKGNDTLSWNFVDISKVTGKVSEKSADRDETSLENFTSEVVFSDVFRKTDLQYIIYGNSLKENIILKSKNAPNEFSIEYKYSGLTPVLSEDKKTISLNNSENETVFVISAPFMSDSNGDISTNLYYELGEIKNNQFSVTLICDREWLDAENRAYPVTVDPDIFTEQKWTETNYQSAYISSDMPYACFGKDGANYEGSLYVGFEENRSKVRSLISFSLPELNDGDRVVSATMLTYLVACYPETTVNVHKVRKSWEQNNVTWNKQPEIDSVISEYKTIPYTDTDDADFVEWDITKLVNEWYLGISKNYGVMLTSPAENSEETHRARFYSSGYTTASTVRPFVILEVRNMSGYEDYYSFTSLNAGRGGSVSVNNYNGNVVSSHPVTLDIGGLRMPVNISAVYNSDKDNMSICDLGKGWQLNYNLQIRPNPYITSESTPEEKLYRYYYRDADGTEHYFHFDSMSSTVGKDEDGLGYTLTLNSASSPTVYTLTDKSGNFMKFNNLGNMTSITDKTGNNIYLVYENAGSGVRVKTIKDGGGRIYTLGYASSTSSVLSTITDPAGRATTFNVSGGVLNSITYPDGKSVTFTYTTVNNTKVLSKVSNYDGIYTEITYINKISNIMAHSITEKGGSLTNDSYSFTYRQNETEVEDSQKRKFTYQFNYFGQPTGIVSDVDKTALGFSYAPGYTTDANANRLLSSSRVQQSVQNYVNDPSFNSGNLSSYYSYQPNAGSDNTTMGYDGTYGHYNNGSYKVSRATANGSWADIDQHISGLPAGTYTASAFISTNGIDVTNGKGVFAVQIVTGSTVTATYRCEPVTKTAAGEWVRRSITVDITEGQYIKVLAGITDNATVGTFWIDDIQLEKGSGVSGFNILSNPSFFRGYKDWTIKDSASNSASVLAGFEKQIKINASTASFTYVTKENDKEYCDVYNVTVKTNAYASQEVKFNGKAGNVFSAGAWIMADSVPTELDKNADSTVKKANCKLRIELLSSGTVKKTEEKEYNPNVSSWQFVSTEIVADTNFDTVRLTVDYNNNRNSISVTGAYVLAEEYGQTYTYDKNGNLISSADVSGSVGSYGFSAGNLNAVTNPTGSSVILANSEANNLLYHAQTTDGQRYDYTYDGSGNVKNLVVGVSKPVTSVYDGESYYIINVGSGKALTASGTTTGSNCKLDEWKAVNKKQQWTAVKSTSTTFFFRLVDNTAVSLDVPNGSSTEGAVIRVATSNPSNAQRFTPVIQKDGAFVLKTYCSGNALAIDCDTNSGGEKKNGTAVQQKSASAVDSYNKWYLIPVNESLKNDLYLEAEATYTATQNFKISETSADGITTSYNSNQNNGFLYTTTTDGIVTGYSQEENTGRVWRVMKDSMAVFYYYSNENLSMIDTPTTEYTFTYDALNRNTKIKAGNYTLAETEYNGYGQVTKQKYLNSSDTVNYTYDSLDRISSAKYNGKELKYYYGSDGNLSYITDDKTGKRTQYEYDLADRVVSVKEFNNLESYLFDLSSSLSYTYVDGTNQLETITVKNSLGENELKLIYGSAKRGEMPDAVKTEYVNGSQFRAYYYDDLGRLEEISMLTATGLADVNYTYKSDGNKTTSQVSRLSNEAGNFDYTYDNRGNIKTVSEGAYKTTYTYDNLDQLVREDNEKLGKSYKYEYSNGNIVSRKEYAYTTGSLGIAIKTDTWTYGDSTWGDVLTAYNGVSTGVSNGKITSLNGKAITYYRQGLVYDAGDTHFSYDTFGRRIKKTTNSVATKFYYAGDMLVGQKTGSNKIEFMFDANGDYYGFEYNDVLYYYVKNLQGDVIAVANSAGNILVRYYYDAWGRLISSTDTSSNSIGTINPIRYRGYYYDTETGFYYLKTRYYSPELCRFLSPDSILDNSSVNTQNLFSYCANNPINRIDPNGDAWYHWALGALVVGACAAATVITCGGFAAAVSAVGMVASGMAAATTASTVAAAAFIGSATAYGTAVAVAAMSSTSVEEFNEQGDWGTIATTVLGAVSYGSYGYEMAAQQNSTISKSTYSSNLHLNGTSSPKNNAIPNGSYTQFDNSGKIYSYAQYNSLGQQSLRIDFQGKSHAGVLPHIHLFSYPARGGKVEYIFDMNWHLIN